MRQYAQKSFSEYPIFLYRGGKIWIKHALNKVGGRKEKGLGDQRRTKGLARAKLSKNKVAASAFIGLNWLKSRIVRRRIKKREKIFFKQVCFLCIPLMCFYLFCGDLFGKFV
jgi:hypothetical protein